MELSSGSTAIGAACDCIFSQSSFCSSDSESKKCRLATTCSLLPRQTGPPAQSGAERVSLQGCTRLWAALWVDPRAGRAEHLLAASVPLGLAGSGPLQASGGGAAAASGKLANCHGSPFPRKTEAPERCHWARWCPKPRLEAQQIGRAASGPARPGRACDGESEAIEVEPCLLFRIFVLEGFICFGGPRIFFRRPVPTPKLRPKVGLAGEGFFPLARCRSSGPLGALLSSPALGVRLPTALQMLQVLPGALRCITRTPRAPRPRGYTA